MPRDWHRDIFLMHNGVEPWPCFECDDPVFLEDLHVHHLDHDHYNNDPANLVASHQLCHNRHHHKGKIVSEATRQKARESNLRTWATLNYGSAILR